VGTGPDGLGRLLRESGHSGSELGFDFAAKSNQAASMPWQAGRLRPLSLTNC
jgi:hypothetical protein